MHRLRAPAALLVAVIVALIALLFSVGAREPVAPVPVGSATTFPVLEATSTVATTSASVVATTSATSTKKKAEKASVQAAKSLSGIPTTTVSLNEIRRIENPYTTAPLPFENVNSGTRAALVNIVCTTSQGGALRPISGSGVIIDPKGIVLTNAHVAQYVLIAQSGRTDLSCTARSGAPATTQWTPVVLYMPPVWVDAHAADIVKEHPLGTGEHDYALLYLRQSAGNTGQDDFPAISPDPREAVAFVDDQVLVAAYPVEFLGGGIIQGGLYPLSSYATIRQLMTFSVGSADVLGLGGVPEAQSGASGGAVVNQWNRLVGLITTTSEGATTGSRDLHAVTASYINRDLSALTGRSLASTIAQSPETLYEAFLPEAAALQQKFFNVILAAR